MACSSLESWRLMLLRLDSELCRSCSVLAWSWETSLFGEPGEICPGVAEGSAPSGLTTILGGTLRALLDGGAGFFAARERAGLFWLVSAFSSEGWVSA